MNGLVNRRTDVLINKRNSCREPGGDVEEGVEW